MSPFDDAPFAPVRCARGLHPIEPGRACTRCPGPPRLLPRPVAIVRPGAHPAARAPGSVLGVCAGDPSPPVRRLCRARPSSTRGGERCQRPARHFARARVLAPGEFIAPSLDAVPLAERGTRTRCTWHRGCSLDAVVARMGRLATHPTLCLRHQQSMRLNEYRARKRAARAA